MSEWISFEDSFPSKKLDSVLTFEMIVHIDTGEKLPMICIEEVTNLYWEDGAFFSDGGGANLTHWMPLPEPPKQ
jgi:hypothetical protein